MTDNKMTAEQALEWLRTIAKISGAVASERPLSFNYQESLKFQAAVKALSAPRVPAVPDGWKLVPVMPSTEILDAISDHLCDDCAGGERIIWRGIVRSLAAAPEPVAQAPAEQLCKHCGGKTMHVGDVCYSCSNQPENEAEPKGCLSLNKLCTYPDCKCPFDMGSENNCLREGDPS